MSDVARHRATPPRHRGADLGPLWAEALDLVVVALILRLVLAPWTALATDVQTWWNVAFHAIQRVPLYGLGLPGYSYPPLYGYWAMAVGLVAHGLGFNVPGGAHAFPASSLFGTLFGPVVTTPAATFLLKLPMIGADLATGAGLWALARHHHVPRARARWMLSAWLFSPLVLAAGTVQGQTDSLVALAIVTVFVAVDREQWALAGVAVVGGLAVKVVPAALGILLVGLVLGRLAGPSRWRALLHLLVGALGASVVIFAPVWNQPPFLGTITRSGGLPAGLGGLNLYGLVALPFTHGVQLTFLSHLSRVGDFTSLALLVATLLGAWHCYRSSTTGQLARSTAWVMATALLTNAVANPQYFVWLLVPLIALYGMVDPTPARRRTLVAINVAALSYLYALFGALFFLAPLSVVTGWPGVGAVHAERSFLARDVPGLGSTSVGVLLAWISTVVMILAIGRALYLLPSVAESPRTSRSPARVWWLPLVAVALVEVVATGGEALLALPQVSASLGPVLGGTVVARVSVGAVKDVTVSVVRVDPTRDATRILYLEDPRYPIVNGAYSDVVSIAQQMGALLHSQAPTITLRVVNADDLARYLRTPDHTASTVIVNLQGELPAPVWSAGNTAPLVNWVKSGGRYVAGGGAPGLFSARSSDVGQFISATSGLWTYVHALKPNPLVPKGIFGYPSLSGQEALTPSVWGSALLVRGRQTVTPITSTRLLHRRGEILGFTSALRASLGVLPVVRGAVVVLGADTWPPEVPVDASDLAHLFALHFFASVGEPRVVTMSTKSASLHLTGVSSGQWVQVGALSAGRPTWAWTRWYRVSGVTTG